MFLILYPLSLLCTSLNKVEVLKYLENISSEIETLRVSYEEQYDEVFHLPVVTLNAVFTSDINELKAKFDAYDTFLEILKSDACNLPQTIGLALAKERHATSLKAMQETNTEIKRAIQEKNTWIAAYLTQNQLNQKEAAYIEANQTYMALLASQNLAAVKFTLARCIFAVFLGNQILQSHPNEIEILLKSYLNSLMHHQNTMKEHRLFY
jgi:hypothetical protein